MILLTRLLFRFCFCVLVSMGDDSTAQRARERHTQVQERDRERRRWGRGPTTKSCESSQTPARASLGRTERERGVNSKARREQKREGKEHQGRLAVTKEGNVEDASRNKKTMEPLNRNKQTQHAYTALHRHNQDTHTHTHTGCQVSRRPSQEEDPKHGRKKKRKRVAGQKLQLVDRDAQREKRKKSETSAGQLAGAPTSLFLFLTASPLGWFDGNRDDEVVFCCCCCLVRPRGQAQREEEGGGVKQPDTRGDSQGNERGGQDRKQKTDGLSRNVKPQRTDTYTLRQTDTQEEKNEGRNSTRHRTSATRKRGTKVRDSDAGSEDDVAETHAGKSRRMPQKE